MLQNQRVPEVSWESNWMKSLGELCFLTFSSEKTISAWVISSGQRTNEVIYLLMWHKDSEVHKVYKERLIMWFFSMAEQGINSQTLTAWWSRLRKNQWLQPPESLLAKLDTDWICYRVSIAGLVPCFEKFACSVILAAPETDVGRLQGWFKQHSQILLLLS